MAWPRVPYVVVSLLLLGTLAAISGRRLWHEARGKHSHEWSALDERGQTSSWAEGSPLGMVPSLDLDGMPQADQCAQGRLG